jgi:hypothetical protein
MNAPAEIPSGFRSLWDVLEINANSFLAATTQLARLHSTVANLMDRDEAVQAGAAAIVIGGLEKFSAEATGLGARLSVMAATRLSERLREEPLNLSIGELTNALWEIESRFGDHLLSVKLFALTEGESVYLQTGSDLLGQQMCDRFPSVIYDMEEAAKCVALGRPTAAVFHCMRALEPPIRAVATFLGIPDPTAPAEKNWGTVLGQIKTKMDEAHPKNKRMTKTDGAILEEIYTTLDSIKNPWRNATMHAEATYQPFEAEHIVKCVNVFLLKVSSFMDEAGQKV